MVEVYRKPKESSAALIRRFSQAVQASKILERLKERQFRKRRLSEREIKHRAIMREALRKLRNKLEKEGRYNEETFKREKKKIKEKLGL